MVGLLPPELDAGAAHLHGQEAAGLAGHALLGLDLDRGGEGPGPDGGVGLHPDGVDGVGRQVADGGQLVVVHKLGLPLAQRQLGLLGEVHFVALDTRCIMKPLENELTVL